MASLSVTAADGSSALVRRPAAVATTALIRYEAEPAGGEDVYEEVVQEAELVEQLPQGELSGLISAPLVGAFHMATPPIAEGSLIRRGQIVGYIESMKLMSELKADIEGVVTEVLIADRQPVEYAQPLLRVMPSEE